MIKVASLSLACFCLASFPLAYAAPAKSEPKEKGPSAEELLSDRLDAFFGAAIAGGLLQSEKGADHLGQHHGSDHGAPQQVLPPTSHDCADNELFDFSSFAHIKNYEDLMVFVDSLEEEIMSGSKDAALSAIKAYIALGLYAEGRLLAEKLAGENAWSLIKLTQLLEQHEQPDISFFRTLAACNQNSQIWLAAGLLYERQEEGVEILSRSQSGFRALPLQMRVDVTSIAIPELDRAENRELARKLLASFDPEEIDGASRLAFSQALLDASEGTASIEDVMQEYMVHPEYRTAAAAALLRYNKPIPAADRDVLLEELIRDLNNERGGRDVPLKLRVALQQMSALSDYSQVEELAALPGMQPRAARDELDAQLLKVLRGDLKSAEPVRVLAVIELLLSSSELLKEHPALPELYKDSVAFANESGYLSLAAELGRQYGQDDVLLAADLAYREKDADGLYALAEQHKDNKQIQIWAATLAIDRNDARTFKSLQDNLPLDIETIVPLIEADALSGNWIVPYAYYVAADEKKTEANAKKIQQILDLRQRERTGKDRVRKTDITHASDVLEASAASLSEFSGETGQ